MITNIGVHKTPTEWGVLCIDVWDNNGNNDKFYHNVINHLSSYNIKAIVNCTLDHLIDYNDHSISNTFERYVWNSKEPNPDGILEHIGADIIKSSGKRPISKILNNELFGENTFSLNSCRAFKHHVQSYYPNITNWILVGGAWGICLHAGPLGIGRLLDSLTAHTFYIFPEWSIQNEDQTSVSTKQIEDDNFVWKQVENDGYMLITKVGGTWVKQ